MLKKTIIFLVILVTTLSITTPVFAAPGINKKLNFQGKVVNNDGTNVTDGNYNFTFKLWDASSVGNSLWTEVWNGGTTQVDVVNGIFNVNLGNYVTFPATVDFNSDNLYLSINFNGDGDMTPRIQMTSVPYAMNAEKVGGLTVTNTTGTLTIPNGKTISFGDGFTTTGVGITLNQNLSTTSVVTFAGLSVGGTIGFTNIPVGTGTTVLYINSSGQLSAGTLPSVGTTYAFTNGLVNLGSNIIGLGGSLTQNTSIGLSSSDFSFDIGNTKAFYVGNDGKVGIGWTGDFNGMLSIGYTGQNSGLGFGPQGALYYEDNFVKLYNNFHHVALSLGSYAQIIGGGLIVDTVDSFGAFGVGNGNASSVNIGRAGVGTLMSGYVGIGNTNSLYALNVAGTLNATTIFQNGVALSSGTTYAFTNGLVNLGSNVIGLGGSLSQTSQIGISTFSLAMIGNGGTPAFYIGSNGRIGIGNSSPNTMLEITSNQANTSGLRFTNLTSASTPSATNNLVLSVDASGNVYLAADQTGTGSLPSGTRNGQTLRFDGAQWVVTNFLENNGSRVGIGTTTPGAILEVAGAGATDLLLLSNNGTTKMRVSDRGSLTVSGNTSDIIKTSNNTGTIADFNYTGSTLVNVDINSDNIGIDTFVGGTIPASGLGAMSTTAINTSVGVTGGGQVIVRGDGSYIVIGGGSTLGSLWNGSSTTMTTVVVATGATAPGPGAIALKRLDGKYFIVHGNGSGYTSVFDPYGVAGTLPIAGPQVCGGGTANARAGTNAFMRPDGNYTILCGGLTAWGVYYVGSGYTGSYTAGSAVGASFGSGSMVLQRDDQTFVVMQGVGGSNYWHYLPTSGAGTMVLNPGVSMVAPALTAGAASVRLQNGQFLIVDGNVNSSWLYDPTVGQYGSFTKNTVAAGYGPSIALGEGAQFMWRPDGKYLLLAGSGSTATFIVDVSSGVGNTWFSTGPVLPATPGGGMTLFMGIDGKYYFLRGGSSTAVDSYDLGFIIGGTDVDTSSSSAYYESECINTNGNLNLSSSLSWKTNSEGVINVLARTGTTNCTTGSNSTYRSILRSGEVLGVGSTSDNYVQVKVIFKRDQPTFMDQEWGVRRNGMTRYRRVNRDPAIYEIKIDNSQSVHKTMYDFGGSSDESGPVTVNLQNDRDKNLGLSLSAGIAYGPSQSGVNGSFYLGSFNNFVTIPGGVGISQTSVIMQRPNGTYTMIIGSTSATPAVVHYDPNNSVFSVGASIPTAVAGPGALAVKRPDGKYLVILGGGTSLTNIYDPVLNNFTAGPNLMGNAGLGAQIIPMPNGRLLVIHGNYLTTSSIYDPYINQFVPGPTTSQYVGAGALALPRPNGTFLISLGNTQACVAHRTTTNTFNPYTMGMSATSPAMTLPVGPGSVAIPRADGNWMVVMGAGISSGTGVNSLACRSSTSTNLFNPYSNRLIAGPVTLNAVGDGANALQRPDGTWLVLSAGGSVPTATSQIYYEKGGTSFISDIGVGGSWLQGPVSLTNIGAGANAFQLQNGKYLIVNGQGTTITTIYDGMWVDKGIYKSEQILVPDLDSNSTLTWKAVPSTGISAEVRTAATKDGLQTASFKEINTPGSMINPANGDKWIQINFNFKRSFPSNGSINADVWNSSGGGKFSTLRTIDNPTLQEYSITKDVNLVDLRNGDESVFRVSSNGNIYTSSSGSISAGGADLAENYTSGEELEKGDVVAIDASGNHNVKKSVYQYQPDLVGVVSSDPGFVAGAYTKDSYPIALVGRVPVKVSNENGEIRVGDRLTSSSVPGIAMKATKAGRVIGKALENSNFENNQINCPETSFALEGRKCTKVNMFVNLTDYMGMPVETVLTENGLAATDENILKLLKELNDETKTNGGDINATRIVAKTILADKIKANSIEGMEIYTDEIKSLKEKYEQLANEATSAGQVAITPTSEPKVGLFTEFGGNVLLKALTEFWGKVLFKGEAEFTKAPVFNNEMAGYAVINVGDSDVSIEFERQFEQSPIVNISMIVDEGVESEIIDNYNFVVTRRNEKGFTIKLNKPAGRELKFSWSAILVRDAKTYQKPTPTSILTPTIMPTISPLPTVFISTESAGLVESTESGVIIQNEVQSDNENSN